ncbi:thiol peroxidase [Streptococcus orisasini]
MTTIKGKPITFAGTKLKVGDIAPDFVLTATDLSRKSLADFAGKKKVISVVPSIDTSVCDAQTRRFNQELANTDNTVVITVSVDLPFAQTRWCGAAGLNDAVTLSDYYDYSFGKAYGLLINELHLLGRAVFVLDENNKITYLEYLDEMGNHPDYEAALAAVKRLG